MFYMPKVMRMFAILLLLHIRQDQRDRRPFWRLNGILVDPRDDFHNTNNLLFGIDDACPQQIAVHIHIYLGTLLMFGTYPPKLSYLLVYLLIRNIGGHLLLLT